jgi:hypothetical protein
MERAHLYAVQTKEWQFGKWLITTDCWHNKFFLVVIISTVTPVLK